MSAVQRPIASDMRSAIGAAFTRPVYLIKLAFQGTTSFLSTEAEIVTSNLLTRSEALDDAAWTPTRVTVTKNARTSPDGLLTAEALIATAVSDTHYHEQPVAATLIDDTAFSGGIYVSKGGWSRVGLQLIAKNNSGPSMVYDFDTKTITATAQGTGQAGVTFSAEDVGDGWHLLLIKNASALTGGTTPALRISLRNDAGSEVFTGDPAKATYAWGAQVVSGSDIKVYARTDASNRGIERYVEGQVNVSGFNWSPDGTQEGNIEIFNENNSAVALVLEYGINDTPVTIWKTYRKSNGSYAVPVLLASGVLDTSTITDSQVILSVVTTSADAEFQPNRYFTKKEGFNFLPAHGLVVTWNDEIFVLESE